MAGKYNPLYIRSASRPPSDQTRAGGLVPDAPVHGKPVIQRPYPPAIPAPVGLGSVLGLDPQYRFSFDNPLRPKYNPLYIGSAAAALSSLQGAD